MSKYNLVMLSKIKESIIDRNVKFTSHARDEMENDEFGETYKSEVYEAILSGGIIEKYEDDKPYPSCLIFQKNFEAKFYLVI